MNLPILSGPYNDSEESLSQYQCPEWFRDAKFGIWSHWGPQSVPMFGDWYARQMFIEGHDQYRHHWRNYGHPSKHGYDEIAAQWKAENFDPNHLMDLYKDAGAKYFFGQAMHHDNFDNFDSKHQPFNSVNVGPKRDICKMWQEAARSKGLPFGLSEHLAASYHWFQPSKRSDKFGPYAGVPYVGADKQKWSIYHPEIDADVLETGDFADYWYTKHEWYHKLWFERIKDVIDKFAPDVLYSDGGVPFGTYGRSIIAHLYNSSVAKNGSNQAVYTQKDTSPQIAKYCVLDIERGQLEGINANPWQTDTSVGDWYYNIKDTYKSPKEVVETLVDIVSKNGNLLLNIPQRPDGTHDEECLYLLQQLSIWTKANGHAVFGSRPWQTSGEGPTHAAAGAFHEKAAEWTTQDFRFTTSKDGSTVYAFQMMPGKSGDNLTLHSLAKGVCKEVNSVMLGNQLLQFSQDSDGLKLSLPPLVDSTGPRAITITLG